MKRILPIAVSMLCLLAVLAAPALCLHVLPQASVSCGGSMQHPMPAGPSPACCTAHRETQPSAVAVTFQLPELAVSADQLAAASLPAVAYLQRLPVNTLASYSPPPIIPLRI